MPSHDPVSHVSPGRAGDLCATSLRAIVSGMTDNDQHGDQMDLTGKLLVAMPGMGDPRFEHSVVLLCAYSDKGAMGLILNKPSPDIRMSDVLDQLEITPVEDAAAMVVHFGGPVETGRGFVLHSQDYQSHLHTLLVTGGFAMTATMDILEEIARGQGPERALMMLGYAGWGPGQLESEIARNGWLTADASRALVFDTPARAKWTAALESLGVDPVLLSADAGRA